MWMQSQPCYPNWGNSNCLLYRPQIRSDIMHRCNNLCRLLVIENVRNVWQKFTFVFIDNCFSFEMKHAQHYVYAALYCFFFSFFPNRRGKDDLSECHKRCANRILAGCLHNGGVYVKLGQGLVAMNHILPEEYLDTLEVRFSRRKIRIKWKMWCFISKQKTITIACFICRFCMTGP